MVGLINFYSEKTKNYGDLLTDFFDFNSLR